MDSGDCVEGALVSTDEVQMARIAGGNPSSIVTLSKGSWAVNDAGNHDADDADDTDVSRPIMLSPSYVGLSPTSMMERDEVSRKCK